MTISIHQPNLCPRASFFEKIAASDLFVIMGHCKYSSSAFQNRFNVGDKMHNMVVADDGQLIVETGYKNHTRDWDKIVTAYPSLSVFSHRVCASLYITNATIIVDVCRKLNITTPIKSDHYTHLKGTERLINLCKTFNADRYLSGISGRNYLDLGMFKREGIEVVFQDEAKIDKRPLYQII